jgi:hypothetical protein
MRDYDSTFHEEEAGEDGMRRRVLDLTSTWWTGRTTTPKSQLPPPSLHGRPPTHEKIRVSLRYHQMKKKIEFLQGNPTDFFFGLYRRSPEFRWRAGAAEQTRRGD